MRSNGFTLVILVVAWMAAATVSAQTVSESGKEPPIKGAAKKAELFATKFSASLDGMKYVLEITLLTSKKTSSQFTTSMGSKHSSGDVKTVPRIAITSRNNPVPEGAKLVIEYYSRPKFGTERELECVEHLNLPALTPRKTVVADGRGIELYSSQYNSYSGRRSGSGKDLCGLIVSLFAPDGTLLVQRVTHQSLLELAGKTMSGPKAFER